MAKKKAPQRLAGAEESCISPEQEAIIQWFRTVKFRKNLLGDYRTQSEDSRDFGPVPLEDVQAKVITLLRRRSL